MSVKRKQQLRKAKNEAERERRFRKKRDGLTSPSGVCREDIFPLFWVAGPSLIVNWSPRLYPTVLYSGGAPQGAGNYRVCLPSSIFRPFKVARF